MRFQGSLFDRLNNIPKDGTNANPIPLPDFTGFVTWDRLEDALRGLRESLERSSNDAAAALASVRQPVHVVERHSQTVRDLSSSIFHHKTFLLVCKTKGKRVNEELIFHSRKKNTGFSITIG